MVSPYILPRNVDGIFHRHCSPARKPTEIAKVAVRDVRWHRRGRPAHLYMADTPTTMWAEFRKHLPPGVDLHNATVRVARVHVDDVAVLDVTDPSVQRVLRISSAELLGDAYGSCQQVADWAVSQGFEGILAPSAAQHGGLTLVVFAAFEHKLLVIEDDIVFGR